MKVLAINGSPRRKGNTYDLIQTIFGELHKEGIETEIFQLGGKMVHGCIGCRKCFENQNQKCIFDDDLINQCIEKMIEADAIIIGSPTYFSNVTTEIKALIDRAGYVCRGNGFLLKHKIGAAVVAVRRAGALHVYNSINQFLLINQMILPGSTYWNLGIGKFEGEALQDNEGIENMKNLGQNIVWLLNKVNN